VHPLARSAAASVSESAHEGWHPPDSKSEEEEEEEEDEDEQDKEEVETERHAHKEGEQARKKREWGQGARGPGGAIGQVGGIGGVSRSERGGVLGGVGSREGWWDEALLEEVYARVDALQHPRTCSAATSLVMSWDNTGLSAVVFFLSGMLEVSLALQRAMVPSDRNPFVFGGCPERNFECIFEAWSNCSAQEVGQTGGDTDEAGGGGGHALGGGGVVGSFPIAAHEAEDMTASPDRPTERYAGKGRLWRRMALLRYVFRLNARTASQVNLQALRTQLGLDVPFIAWHVRLHVQDDLRLGRSPSLERHIEAVRMLAMLYKVSTVFVATDDATIAQRAADLCPELTVRWYSGFNRSMLQECGGVTNDCWLEGRLARGDLDANHLTNAWLVDVLLLSHGHAFVGQWGSNLSRLAYLLAANRRRSLLPFISLDGPWRFSHLPMGLFV
jgi:hypothetical protein